MNKLTSIFILVLLQITFIGNSNAADFEWLNNLNVRAEADSSGFRVSLATRFHIGDVEVRTIIGQVGHASDAYMVLRLGELSHRPFNEVINVYHHNKHKGWGRMAKELGIKPGSKEFHALKRGHDLDLGKNNQSDKSSTKGKNGKNKKKKNKGKN